MPSFLIQLEFYENQTIEVKILSSALSSQNMYILI